MGALSDNPGHEEKGLSFRWFYRLEGLRWRSRTSRPSFCTLQYMTLTRKWWSQEKAQDKRGCKADWDNSLEEEVLPDPEANQEDEERVMVTLMMTER